MKPKLLFLFTTLLCFGCSVNRSALHELKAEETALALKVMVQAADTTQASSLPSKNEWKADRDTFIREMNGFSKKNEKIKKRAGAGKKSFAILGATIGVSGGIVGLSSSKSTLPSIGSLIAGGLASIAAIMGFDKDNENAAVCSALYADHLTTFRATWSDIRFPTTQTELDKYYKDKDDIIRALSVKGCMVSPPTGTQ